MNPNPKLSRVRVYGENVGDYLRENTHACKLRQNIFYQRCAKQFRAKFLLPVKKV